MIRVIIEHFLLPANKQHLGLLDGGRSPSREGARRVRRPHVSNDLELTHISVPLLSSPLLSSPLLSFSISTSCSQYYWILLVPAEVVGAA